MGLFKKENCVLCGGKTGILDKKCYDGKVCKECTKKLSVWFDNYKGFDKALLEGQIAIREMDADVAKTMNFSKVFGEYGVILIDEQEKKFIAFPDTSKGLFGSYNPPHMIYMENFILRLKLEHPYISAMNIQLNDGAVQIHNEGRRLWTDPDRKLAAHLLDLPGLVKENQEAVYDNESLLHVFLNSNYEMPDYSYGFKCSLKNWEEIRRYHYYLAMAREIQDIIMGNK